MDGRANEEKVTAHAVHHRDQWNFRCNATLEMLSSICLQQNINGARMAHSFGKVQGRPIAAGLGSSAQQKQNHVLPALQ